MKRWIRKSHRWLGVVSCVFLLLVSLTALALNHRNLWLAWTLPGEGAAAASADFSLQKAKAWAADPFVQGHILASSDKHLFESFDQGQHWQELKLFIPAEHVLSIAYSPVTPEKVWVGLRDVGIFYSEDNGVIWEELSDLPFDPVAGERFVSLVAGAEDTLYIQSLMGHYVYHSPTQRWQGFPRAQAQQKLDLQTWVWELHTGKFLGAWGVYVYDGVAVSLILLSLSGLVLSWRKKPMRKAPLRA